MAVFVTSGVDAPIRRSRPEPTSWLTRSPPLSRAGGSRRCHWPLRGPALLRPAPSQGSGDAATRVVSDADDVSAVAPTAECGGMTGRATTLAGTYAPNSREVSSNVAQENARDLAVGSAHAGNNSSFDSPCLDQTSHLASGRRVGSGTPHFAAQSSCGCARSTDPRRARQLRVLRVGGLFHVKRGAQCARAQALAVSVRSTALRARRSGGWRSGGWRSGGLAVRRSGGPAVWRSGGLAVWRSGGLAVRKSSTCSKRSGAESSWRLLRIGSPLGVRLLDGHLVPDRTQEM